MSRDWVKDVGEFHEACGVEEATEPGGMPGATWDLRMRLLREELEETMEAMQARDIVGTMDGCIDLIVIAIGTLRVLAGRPNAAWNEVHRSNMSKVGPDGTVEIRADGKIIKGPHYSPPDIAAVLGRGAP